MITWLGNLVFKFIPLVIEAMVIQYSQAFRDKMMMMPSY